MAKTLEQLLEEVSKSESALPESRALIIDDEPAVVDIIERVLTRADISVITATSGELGLELLESEPSPGVVLVDKNLPDVSGIEIVERGKQLEPDAQFIVITGYASVESAIEAMELGAFGYITKPFDDLDVIRKRVFAALEKTRGVLRQRVLLARLREAYEDLYAENQKLDKTNQKLRDKLAKHGIE